MQNPILLFVLSIIHTPLLLGVILLGFICRRFRNMILGTYLRRKYGKGVRFLASNDAMCAVEGPNNPIYGRGFFLIKGKANISAYQNLVYTDWVKSTLPDNTYKLSCRLCCEFGYFFWVPVKDFKIERHCYLHDFVPKNEQGLNTYYGDFFNRRFSDDLPPWSATCINLDENFPGLHGPHHIFLTHFHHALCDGVSFMLLCKANIFKQTTVDTVLAKFNPSNVPTMTKLNLIARALVFGQGAAICNLFNFPDKNILYGNQLTGTRLFACSETISLDRIKKIKNITNTTVNDVVTSCVAGGLRSYFLRNGISPKSNKYFIPVALHALNKPPKLENRLTPVVFHDAVDQSTPIERLRRTQMNMNEIKNTVFPFIINIALNALSNAVPRYVSTKVSESLGCTLALSNIPGPDKPYYVFDNEVIRIGTFTAGVSKIGMGISITTYNGETLFGINADVAVMKTRENLDRLLDDIVHEFEELEKSI